MTNSYDSYIYKAKQFTAQFTKALDRCNHVRLCNRKIILPTPEMQRYPDTNSF